MDPETTVWLGRIVAATIVSGLGIAIRNLFVRTRNSERAIAVLNARPVASDKAGTEAREDLQKFKLCVAEGYVRRDDYVAQMAGVLTKLDAIGVMVARVDERVRIDPPPPNEP